MAEFLWCFMLSDVEICLYKVNVLQQKQDLFVYNSIRESS